MREPRYITIDDFKFRWKYGTDNIVVLGAHWQGKSVLSAELLTKPLIGRAPVWIWDHKGRFMHLAPQNIVGTVDQLVYGTQILKPADTSLGNFERFCALVNKQRRLHVVIDETHHFCSAHRLPYQFSVLVRDKGNDDVSYCCIFQRPATVHKDILNNAAHRFTFAFDVPGDVKYLSDWIGPEVELFLEPDSTNRRYYRDESGKKYPKLPRYSFIYRDMHELQPIVVVGGLKLK